MDLLQPVGRSRRLARQQPGCSFTRRVLWYGWLGRTRTARSCSTGPHRLCPSPVLLELGAILGSSRADCCASTNVCPGLISMGLGHWCLHPYALLIRYTALPYPFNGFLYCCRQWHSYSCHVSWSVVSSYHSIKICFEQCPCRSFYSSQSSIRSTMHSRQ